MWTLKDTLLHTPQKGVVLNASNEVAVAHFLSRHIPFGEISALVLAMIESFADTDFSTLRSLESICALDKNVRAKSTEWLQARGYSID